MRRYWTEDIKTDISVKAQLLLLTVSTGIQDAVSFPDFRCFASNQTGNTVLFAVSLSGAGTGLFDLMNTSISLVAFATGCFLAGQTGNIVGRRKRYWQFVSQVMQCALIFGAASIQLVYADGGAGGYLALMLLALGSGVQVGTARAMDVPEITTAMATAAWVDFMIDAHLFELRNKPRNRRILFLLALVAGSFAGAFLRARHNSATAIFMSGGIKMLVTFGILVPGGSKEVEAEKGFAMMNHMLCENAAKCAQERRQVG